jgi:hypothetical protein
LEKKFRKNLQSIIPTAFLLSSGIIFGVSPLFSADGLSIFSPVEAAHICVGPDGRRVPCPPEGDLSLISVRAIQAPADPNVLVAGMYTMAKIELESTFQGDLRNVPYTFSISYCSGPPGGPFACSPSPACPAPCVFPSIPIVTQARHTYYVGPPVTTETSAQGRIVYACVNVILDPGNTVDETNESNNGRSDCIPLKATKPLSVLYIPIVMSDDRGAQLTPDEIDNFVYASDNFLKGTWPLASNGYSSTTNSQPVGISPNCEVIQNRIDKIGCTLNQLRGNYDKVVAIVREYWFGPGPSGEYIGGIAPQPRIADSVPATWAIIAGKTPYTDSLHAPAANILAHELAHTYAWVPYGHSLDCPTSPGHLCPTLGGGYWVAEGREIPPANDFSAHGPPCCADGEVSSWVTRATFDYLLNRLKADPNDPATILITAHILNNGTTVNYPWSKMTGTPDIPLNNPGKFNITYLDDAEQRIAQTGFDFNSIPSNPKLPFSPLLSLRIPDIEGTNRIIISNDTTVLIDRTFSAHVPSVRILSPANETEFKYGDTVNLVWNASDVDNDDKLTYSIFMSSDNGSSWNILTSGMNEKEFKFVIQPTDSDLLTLRVAANDGINTSTDEVCIEIKNQSTAGCPPVSQFGSLGHESQYSNLTGIIK